MPPLIWYAVVLAVAAGATAACTWPARWLAIRVGHVDVPDDRKIHTQTVPYGGGAAMFMGFLVAMLVAGLLSPLHVIFTNSSEPLGIVLAGAAIFFVGLIDDARGMSAPAKMAGRGGPAAPSFSAGLSTPRGGCRHPPRWRVRCWRPASCTSSGSPCSGSRSRWP